jgi:methyl-accepting chemotaxis protein
MSLLSNLSVRPKLIMLLLTFAVVPAIAMYGVFLSQEETLRKDAQDALAHNSESSIDTLDRNLFERYGDVQAFGFNTAAYDPANYGKPESGNPLIVAMNNYVRAYGFYPITMLVNTEGRVLAVNTQTAQGKDVDTRFVYSQNFKDAKWFHDALNGKFLEGKNGFTGTAVQPPARNELVAKAYGTDGFSLTFSAQVHNSEGKLIGVWVNFADFSLVEDIIGAHRKVLVDKGWSKSDIMLIDADGTILVDYDPQNFDNNGKLKRDFDNVGKKNLVKLGLKSAAAAVQGKNGAMTEFSPDSNSMQVFGYNHSDGAYDFPGLGWSMLIGMDEAMVYKTMHDVERGMMLSGAAVLGVALLFGFWFGGVAAKPLRRSTDIMLKLAEGDLQVDVPEAHGKDEFNAITRSLQTFKDNGLRLEQMKIEQKRREQEATEMQRKLMHDLADGFEASVGQIVGTVASASTELQANAESLSMIADETTKQSTAVAAATEEASVSVQTVAASTEELSSSINEISRQVSESTRITSDAVREVKNTDQTVVSLAEAAGQIGGVVKLIQDIAEQTNLLALNATIEAARAGEAGKGFAVVASEVKSLANQTAKATEEISSKITAMQGVTNTAVTAIRGIGSTIEQISHIIGGIASAVEEQSAATKEIANNVAQASAGTSEVAGSITNVNQAAGESRGAANDVLQAARELSVQSERLKDEMAGFLNKIRNS